MARRADELHDRVVVVNPEEDCSPAAFRLLIDELLTAHGVRVGESFEGELERRQFLGADEPSDGATVACDDDPIARVVDLWRGVV